MALYVAKFTLENVCKHVFIFSLEMKMKQNSDDSSLGRR